MAIQLGISPINWCNDDDPSLGEEISFEQCINEMALSGYVATELGNKYPKQQEILKSALDLRGLQLSSAWFSTYFTVPELYEATLERFMEHMSFMRAMGASFINVCECGHSIQGTDKSILGNAKPQFNEEQRENLISGLHAIGRIANDFKVQLAYHYHAGTGVFKQEEIDFLMTNTCPTLVSLLLDTGHALFAGINPIDLIKKYRERITYVHLKDVRKEVLETVRDKGLSFMDAVRAGVFTVPGDGAIDFQPIISQLQTIGYQGWAIVEAEQDPGKANPLHYAKMAFDYLIPMIS
ncbi:myo-inosose-2 dehydratase [Legionella waltersii]|uniref:Myo-inositol catabolism protein iolE n=1 Tax=Legionella waltersii TaxID=66969 RepID=A0A0W1A183_9GAMM|nr:myo-inosose-2 dehydratase [Legionella waltersii]KTD75138.1 myo-inositol catabolism protein iolE [Legionella waltersii]SNV04868.1 myo-inositol catabolism protein iolE [Legionella waltersii]